MAMDDLTGPRVVALVRDLFFGLRIANTLRPHGYRVESVNTAAQLSASLGRGQPNLIVIDLACAACDPIASIAALKGSKETHTIPILAFGPHVDRDGRDAAKAAGADRVVANSKLHDDLVPLVARYASRGALSQWATEPVTGAPEQA